MPTLDLNTLESWLWDSANILRGSIDSSDFKNYIFGLLFLKRVNDDFEEEIENKMEQEGISREDAEDEAYFKVPGEASWEELKKKTENIGEALDKAFAAIERENTSLESVMTATKYGDKERLPLAPILEQQKIANILSEVDNKLEVLQEKKQEYSQLKKSIDAAIANREDSGNSRG